MRIRNFVLVFFLGVLCLAEGNWQTATELPGVDTQGLTGARRQAAFKFLREETCTCGCNMKLAECRMKDPSCSYSRKLSSVAMKGFAAGKTASAVRAEVKKVADTPPPVFEDPVKISLAGDPIKGPANARVTIVEFSDFQCPFCTKAVADEKEILRRFPKDVRLVYKQFPLDSHADAEFGAEAALAAQAQGKFWEMHDLLYAGFPNLARKTVLGYAKELNLNMKQFISDLDSHKFRTRVFAEEQEGEAAGVGGTPTFFFNGRKYNGIFDVATVEPLIRKELKR
ncbi:MAG TPA: DsbA family protein [Bryobacteraceae bacterium]|nr:DsbA family protein [Bryobacteraceae bacterium]